MATFTGADIERLLGLSTQTLTNWRAEGWIEGFGDRFTGKRVLFSAEDVAAFHLSQILRSLGETLAQALITAHAYRHHLAAHVRGTGPALSLRYLALTADADGSGSTQPLAECAELDGEIFQTAVVVDLARVAAAMPETVRRAIIENE